MLAIDPFVEVLSDAYIYRATEVNKLVRSKEPIEERLCRIERFLNCGADGLLFGACAYKCLPKCLPNDAHAISLMDVGGDTGF